MNQQEKKRRAGTVHFGAKMPSKNDDDDSDDKNELNQFESLSINGADDNEESSSDGSNNWSSGQETSSNECNSLDQMIDVNLSIRGTLVGHPSNFLCCTNKQRKENAGCANIIRLRRNRQFYERRARS